MTCAEISELARQHTDGPLPVRVRMHVAMCKHCRRYLRQLRATVAVLRGLGDDAPADAGPADAVIAAFRDRSR